MRTACTPYGIKRDYEVGMGLQAAHARHTTPSHREWAKGGRRGDQAPLALPPRKVLPCYQSTYFSCESDRATGQPLGVGSGRSAEWLGRLHPGSSPAAPCPSSLGSLPSITDLD